MLLAAAGQAGARSAVDATARIAVSQGEVHRGVEEVGTKSESSGSDELSAQSGLDQIARTDRH